MTASDDRNVIQEDQNPDQYAPISRLGVKWPWLVGLGIVAVLAGLAALLAPLAAELAVVTIIGVLLIIGGAAQAFHTFHTRDLGPILLSALVALLYLVTGVITLVQPLLAILTLTLLLGIFLTIQGVVKAVAAWQLRPRAHWLVMLTDGLVTTVLGLLIWFAWPGAALWVIGLFVGVDLVLTGLTMAACGLHLRAGKTDPPG